MLIPTFKSGQESVMIWSCFIKNKLGPLVVLTNIKISRINLSVLSQITLTL